MKRKQNSSKRGVSKMAKAGVMAAMMTAAVWCSPMSVSAEPLGCAANLNGDGTVGSDDLALLLGDWGLCEPEADCPCDLDGDGKVASGDLARLLGMWGQDMCTGSPVPMTAAYYDCVDLDIGVVIDSPIPGLCESEEVEFHFAYNADDTSNPPNPTRIFTEPLACIVYFDDLMPFEGVTCAMLPLPCLGEALIDLPLLPQHTVVILTVDGDYYKVGNAVAEFEGDEYTVAFDYAPLCPPNGASE